MGSNRMPIYGGSSLCCPQPRPSPTSKPCYPGPRRLPTDGRAPPGMPMPAIIRQSALCTYVVDGVDTLNIQGINPVMRCTALRGVRAEPSIAGTSDAGPARPTQDPDQRRTRARAPRLDDLGPTFEAGIQDRHLDLRALWGCGQGDRVHRRSGGDQENPRSSRAARRGRDPSLQTLRPSAALSTIAAPERPPTSATAPQ